MTKNELLNAFIQQAAMQWTEEEAEKEATIDDVNSLMHIIIILRMAFATLRK